MNSVTNAYQKRSAACAIYKGTNMQSKCESAVRGKYGNNITKAVMNLNMGKSGGRRTRRTSRKSRRGTTRRR